MLFRKPNSILGQIQRHLTSAHPRRCSSLSPSSSSWSSSSARLFSSSTSSSSSSRLTSIAFNAITISGLFMLYREVKDLSDKVDSSRSETKSIIDPLHQAALENIQLKKALTPAKNTKKFKKPKHLADRPGRKEDEDTLHVYRVVLTGGPCGGKSSSLKHFTRELTAAGFDVYAAPEVPTILMNGGCHYPGIDGGQALIDYERALIQLQLQTERSFTDIAASTKRPSVVVYDRGICDIAAYLPKDKWQEVLDAVDMTEDQALSRYDMVLHLVTAADGAESFYTNANNAVRKETPEQARSLDRKVRKCWQNHPKVEIVDNSTGFQEKLNRSTQLMLNLVKNE